MILYMMVICRQTHFPFIYSGAMAHEDVRHQQIFSAGVDPRVGTYCFGALPLAVGFPRAVRNPFLTDTKYLYYGRKEFLPPQKTITNNRKETNFGSNLLSIFCDRYQFSSDYGKLSGYFRRGRFVTCPSKTGGFKIRPYEWKGPAIPLSRGLYTIGDRPGGTPKFIWGCDR